MQLGGVARLNPACRRVLYCSAQQLPKGTSGIQKVPSHHSAVCRVQPGQSLQCRGKRDPQVPNFLPLPPLNHGSLFPSLSIP